MPCYDPQASWDSLREHNCTLKSYADELKTNLNIRTAALCEALTLLENDKKLYDQLSQPVKEWHELHKQFDQGRKKSQNVGKQRARRNKKEK